MGKQIIERMGQIFGRLTVISRAENSPDGKVRWLCRCSCGSTSIVRSRALARGLSQSCGCLQRDITIERNFKHGEAHSKEHRAWRSLRSRCTNPRSTAFKSYGGRGIKVCERWERFENFLADILATIGRGPKDMTLDRINNDGNYEPGNVRWATRQEQAYNRRDTIPIAKVREARRLARQGGMSRTKIAKAIGIHKQSVSDIITGKHWGHVV